MLTARPCADLTLEHQLRFAERVKGASVLIVGHLINPESRDQICAASCEILEIDLVAVPADQRSRIEQACLSLNGLKRGQEFVLSVPIIPRRANQRGVMV